MGERCNKYCKVLPLSCESWLTLCISFVGLASLRSHTCCLVVFFSTFCFNTPKGSLVPFLDQWTPTLWAPPAPLCSKWLKGQLNLLATWMLWRYSTVALQARRAHAFLRTSWAKRQESRSNFYRYRSWRCRILHTCTFDALLPIFGSFRCL